MLRRNQTKSGIADLEKEENNKTEKMSQTERQTQPISHNMQCGQHTHRIASQRHMHRLKRYWRKNPDSFVEHQLGLKPWSKQKEILKAVSKNRRVAVRSCNGSGKTFTAATVAIWWLMSHDSATVITTAPTTRQVRHILWREIRNIVHAHPELIGGTLTTNKLEIDNQRFAYGFSTSRKEWFQGFHHQNLLFIIDEAAAVKEEILEAIEGSITSTEAKILMIGNPQNLKGTFYNAFHKDRTQWKNFHISAFETPNFTKSKTDKPTPGLASPHWEKEMRQKWGKQSSAYQIRVLGQFPSADDDALIPLMAIENAVYRYQNQNNNDNDIEKRNAENMQTYMGLDVARFGNDNTVACIRRGNQVTDLKTFPKSDIMTTTGTAINMMRENNVDTIFIDEVGIGAGIIDRMHELGIKNSIGINGGKAAIQKEKYLNKRTEIYDALRSRFLQDDIQIPDDQQLISELASLKYKFNSRGQMMLEDKQTLRDRGEKSPDKADALMLAFTPQPKIQIWL